jgi:hypothetical protein
MEELPLYGLLSSISSTNPPTNSYRILLMTMSSPFRSAADRASVVVEESHDGRVGWGRVRALVHRPDRR